MPLTVAFRGDGLRVLTLVGQQAGGRLSTLWRWRIEERSAATGALGRTVMHSSGPVDAPFGPFGRFSDDGSATVVWSAGSGPADLLDLQDRKRTRLQQVQRARSRASDTSLFPQVRPSSGPTGRSPSSTAPVARSRPWRLIGRR